VQISDASHHRGFSDTAQLTRTMRGAGHDTRPARRPPSNDARGETFGERCGDMAVTLKQDQAEYVVLLEHDGNRKIGRKRNKVAVVNRNGRVIYSHSTRTLGNAVQDSCRTIREAKSQGTKTTQQAAYR
jgi:hypothetical protein